MEAMTLPPYDILYNVAPDVRPYVLRALWDEESMRAYAAAEVLRCSQLQFDEKSVEHVARLAVDAEGSASSGRDRTGQAVAWQWRLEESDHWCSPYYDVRAFNGAMEALQQGGHKPIGRALGVIATPSADAIDSVSGGACRPSWGSIEPDEP